MPSRPLMMLGLVCAGLLTSCIKPSLDLSTPADAHQYMERCVQDFGPDCEVMLPTVKTLGPEISVLIFNGDATEQFTAYASQHGLTLAEFMTSPWREKYARANIFPVGRLTTGTITALDGTPHQFVCEDEFSCIMDGKEASPVFTNMPRQRTGTVYLTFSTIFP